jgi:hypothetical protein
MPRRLAIAMVVTDGLFIAYWALSALAAARVIHLPGSLIYAGYAEPRVRAWNWSFLLPDAAFSATGLAALRAARRGDMAWQPLSLLSLAFTMMAGGMAIAYWALLGEFDPAWFLPNLAIFLWPLAFLPGLLATMAQGLRRC